MIDMTLNIGGLDLSSKLSTYSVRLELTYPTNVTTMDGTEHVVEWKRPVVKFSLIPLSDAQINELYNKLKDVPITVTYFNTYLNTEVTAQMRVSSDLEQAFGIKSVDGNRYYKGAIIELRQLTVM